MNILDRLNQTLVGQIFKQIDPAYGSDACVIHCVRIISPGDNPYIGIEYYSLTKRKNPARWSLTDLELLHAGGLEEVKLLTPEDLTPEEARALTHWRTDNSSRLEVAAQNTK